jgi:hypothetical protein
VFLYERFIYLKLVQKVKIVVTTIVLILQSKLV